MRSMTSTVRRVALACSLLLLAVPVAAQDLCRELRGVMTARDLRSLAGSLEKYNATKPSRLEGMDIDGGEYSKWEARRVLPGFVTCTVNQYVTVKLSGARVADPIVYNCKKSASRGSEAAERDFEELSRTLHACLPGARRTDDVPAEKTRAWAGEKRATIRQDAATAIVSYRKVDGGRGGYELNVDISRE